MDHKVMALVQEPLREIDGTIAAKLAILMVMVENVVAASTSYRTSSQKLAYARRLKQVEHDLLSMSSAIRLGLVAGDIYRIRKALNKYEAKHDGERIEASGLGEKFAQLQQAIRDLFGSLNVYPRIALANLKQNLRTGRSFRATT